MEDEFDDVAELEDELLLEEELLWVGGETEAELLEELELLEENPLVDKDVGVLDEIVLDIICCTRPSSGSIIVDVEGRQSGPSSSSSSV